MAVNENLMPIPGRLHSVATEGHVAGANEIYDDDKGKLQSVINSEVDTALANKVGTSTKVNGQTLTEDVDIIIEGYLYEKKFYEESSHTTEITGNERSIYIDKPTNREYRWDGTKYVLLKSEVDGSFVSEGTFTYRPTAGAIDVESSAVGEGGAQIECVKGNTIAWNQMIQNGDFSDDINGWFVFERNYSIANDVITISNATPTEYNKGIVYFQKFGVTGHKYMCSFRAASSNPRTINVEFYNDVPLSSFETTSSLSLYKCIVTPTSFDPNVGFLLKFNDFVGEQDETYSFSNIQVIDLTLVYGEGNEPTTPEQFEADYQKWFGKPLTYEEYDEGSLRSVEMTGIKTVGFNLWDEEYKNGWYSMEAGVYVVNPGQLCTKNKIKIEPNTQYCLKIPVEEENALLYYDADGNYLGYDMWHSSNGFALFTTPANASYMNIDFGNQYGNTYNHDICINLSHSGDRNGDYEPYWEHTANLPVTSLKGKLNGEGESVVIFPDGMKKAGNVFDEIVKRGNQTVAIKRIGQLDLGTFDWKYESAARMCFCLWDENRQKYITNSTLGIANTNNMVCSKYPVIPDWPDGKYIRPNSTWFLSKPQFFVVDDDYTDAATFKASLDGVMLYYELATPEEYIIDDIDFPTEYPVDDYGTEEILSDSAKSLAPTLDIRYGLNATDTLRNLPTKYVSAIVEQNFTEEQKTRARINIGLDNLSRLGGGYGLCYTDATTAAKVVSISHFLLLVNGIVSVRFTKAVSVDNATLNVSGSGAKPILINGEALQKGLIKAGMTATLQYDSTNWNIISMMGLEQSTTPSDLYVDMGLPSGTLWAKANIDVTTQSGFAEVDGKPSPFKYECSFFSWGNVGGHHPISESAFDYDWGTSNDGPYAQTPGAALTADAGLSFDAARANLGSPWRDPSTDDFVELFDNIDFVQADGETVIDASQTNKLVTVNNIVGIYLKSKINGNLLFFSCSGHGYGQSRYSCGSGGSYWSHSLYSQSNGRHLSFVAGEVNPQYNNTRNIGFPHRAVQ